MSVTDKEIAQMMDLSCVQANSTPDEIRNAADTAIEYGCICVFTLPAHIPFLVSLLKGHDDIMIGGPVGFPDGGATTKGKVREAQELLDMGADELDMVLNIGWLKAGDYEAVARDIRAVVEIAGDTPVKVILECHYLTNDEIVKACEIAVDCGVAFVKTGTGWAETGATLENVKLMVDTVKGRCKVKAAGGVRDKETLLAMHELGVVRFGIGVRTATAIFKGGKSPQSY